MINVFALSVIQVYGDAFCVYFSLLIRIDLLHMFVQIKMGRDKLKNVNMGINI